MAFDLDILIRDYLDSVGGQPPISWSERRKTWERDLLHVTDLNACPRAVALRLRGEREEPRAPQEARKFVLANFQHELIYAALDWAGLLIDKEVPVPLPDGWTGTADMVVAEFHDEDGESVNVADSKNPVAGADKYAATYPKAEDIRQVSVYSFFLRTIYRQLAQQDEGQVFYLPLGGASRWLPTRFALISGEDVSAAMAELEVVRDVVPDPLPLSIGWYKRRLYERKDGTQTVSGDLYYSTDWRCRYCRFACPNREKADSGVRLCRVGSGGISDLTSEGRRLLPEIEEFLDADAQR